MACAISTASASVAEVSVQITPSSDGGLSVLFDFSKPRRQICFGPDIPGRSQQAGDDRYFAYRWGAAFIRSEGPGLCLKKRDARAFEQLSIELATSDRPNAVDYVPLLRVSPDASVLYTGAIWPWSQTGERLGATFEIGSAEGLRVDAFGRRIDGRGIWQSPHHHPAFLFLSSDEKLEPAKVGGQLTFYGKQTLPDWLAERTTNVATRAFAHFENHLGPAPGGATDFILSRRDRGEDLYAHSIYGIAGDALPGQISLVFEGLAWEEETETAQRVVDRAIVHEIFHLWQVDAEARVPTALPPSDLPAFIHEGAAEAAAGEALVAMGLWTPREKRDFDRRAVDRCDEDLSNRTLVSLNKTDDFTAVYACGHALALAAAGTFAAPSPVIGFWQAFLTTTGEDDGGYRYDTWLRFVGEWQGEPARSDTFKRFMVTPRSHPARALQRLARPRLSLERPGSSTNPAALDRSPR